MGWLWDSVASGGDGYRVGTTPAFAVTVIVVLFSWLVLAGVSVLEFVLPANPAELPRRSGGLGQTPGSGVPNNENYVGRKACRWQEAGLARAAVTGSDGAGAVETVGKAWGKVGPVEVPSTWSSGVVALPPPLLSSGPHASLHRPPVRCSFPSSALQSGSVQERSWELAVFSQPPTG